MRAPKRIEAVFGTLVHSALKYMFERGPLYPTQDEVIDFFTKRFNEKSESVVWPDQSKKESAEKQYYEEGVKLLKNFYTKNKPWNFNPIELESRFFTELKNEKTGEIHTIAGIIDRIDKNPENDDYEIIDYKTGKKMPSQESLVDNLQLGLYSLALSARWPALKPKDIKTSLYFLKHNDKISTTASEERMIRTKKVILDKIEEIQKSVKNDIFPPTPSPLCDWCGFRKICPMWSHLYEEKKETPDEKAASGAIREYTEIKEREDVDGKRLKELREIILSYMDSKKIERVFSGNSYITKTLQSRFSFNMEKLKGILERLGKWVDILAPDTKKIDEILPSLSEAEQEEILSTREKKSFVMLKQSKK